MSKLHMVISSVDWGDYYTTQVDTNVALFANIVDAQVMCDAFNNGFVKAQLEEQRLRDEKNFGYANAVIPNFSTAIRERFDLPKHFWSDGFVNNDERWRVESYEVR